MPEKRENYAFPHSSEAERAVLGAILRHPDSFSQVVEKVQLQGEHFFVDNHRQIFEVMTHLDSSGKPIDYFTISEALTKFQVPPNLPFLIELVESSPVTENVEHYASAVKEKYYLRRIIKVCEEASLQARTGSNDAKEFLGEVEKEFLKIVNEHERDQVGLISAKEVLQSTIEELEKRKNSGGEVTGISSGFTDLDRITSGWQKSDLIILAARPGMGKTALALNWGLNAVMKHPQSHVAVFTLEMSKEQLMERLISSVGKIDSANLRRGNFGDDEVERIMYAAREINKIGDRLVIDETPGISVAELRARCRRYKREHGLDLILIDYLQLMTGSQIAAKQSREREIGEISTNLKALAKELAVPVIALAQLNRGPDARTDKRPLMSDLRESGSMEQDADLIMFVYRDEYYNKESADVGKSEILIKKNRHGATGEIFLAWLPNFVSFHNLLED